MTIPLLDLSAQHAALAEELESAFRRVVSSGQFILGREVDAFEQEASAFLRLPHAIGVSSGTDALLVSLMALDVGPGDEVITTPYSFFATAGVIARLGAVPVFGDIDSVTYNLDPASVAPLLGPRTKAIVAVHLFGQPMDIAELTGLGVPVIEDAAQAFGACGVGTAGAVACFSFFPSKNLGALGDGGLVATRDAALAKRIRRLRAHGAEPKYFHSEVGGNFRLDALQAALLRVKLPHVAEWNHVRRDLAKRYTSELESLSHVDVPRVIGRDHVFHQYVVRSPLRDALQAHLRDAGVGTAVYYPRPLHLQECFAQLGYAQGSRPEAEAAAATTLALPMYPELSSGDQQVVVDLIRRGSN